MTMSIPTLNVTVAQIEADLRAGKTVDEIAAEWSEPRGNVAAVLRDMRARDADAPKPVPLTSVPTYRPSVDLAGVDALVTAAARSTSKRTQALGVRLADLTKVVRDRLHDERKAAEEVETQRAEREKAAADVARLEAQLRDAKAKLRPPKRTGASGRKGNSSPKPFAAGEYLCGKGCGRTFTYPGPRGVHEKKCTGSTA